MESKDTKEKKTLQEYIRMLHRNIGFFVIGLTIIYSLSGIVLVYRTTDFLKQYREIGNERNDHIRN